MKSYRGVITLEIAALLAVVILLTGRGALVWYAMLGKAQAQQGSRPPQAQVAGYTFTTLGVIAGALAAMKWGKGQAGLAISWGLGAMLLGATLLYYRQILGVFVQAPAPAQTAPSQGGQS